MELLIFLKVKMVQKIIKAYEDYESVSAAALNSIKGEVITLAEKRGFGSALDETLFNSRMDQQILDAMLSAMKDHMENFKKYYRRKAELLGHTGGLPFYDVFAPLSTSEDSSTYTFDEVLGHLLP